MGWLAPRVWDPGADSLSARKREREEEEKRYVLNRRMSHSLHPSNALSLFCSFPAFISLSLSQLSRLISSAIFVSKYHLLSVLIFVAVTCFILSRAVGFSLCSHSVLTVECLTESACREWEIK